MIGFTSATDIKLFSFVTLHFLISFHGITAQFYGSPIVLDASFNDNEEYISAFTVPSNKVTITDFPVNINDRLLKQRNIDIETLYIKLMQDNHNYKLNLTHIQRFPLLRHLWIVSSIVDNMNKVDIFFTKYDTISRLEISHLHIHVRTLSLLGFDSLLPLLNNLTVFDLRNSPEIQSRLSLTEMFIALRRNQFCFLTLCNVQQLFSNGIYYPNWNLSRIFSGNFGNGIKYLDLSRNDIQTLDTNFITYFPQLVVLDISYNLLSITFDYYTPARLPAWMVHLLLLHPSIRVLDMSRQYLNQRRDTEIYTGSEIINKPSYGRQKRALNISDRVRKHMETCIETDFNNLFINRTQFADALNCFMGVKKSSAFYVPSVYMPDTIDLLDWSCLGQIRLPIAPKLQVLWMEDTYYDFMRNDRNVKQTFCVAKDNNLRTMRLSSNGFDTSVQQRFFLKLNGFAQLEVLHIRDMQTLKFMPNYLQEFPSIKTLFMGNNDNVLTPDVQICKHLRQLTILELSNSNMKVLPRHFLKNCVHLEYLDLSQNKFVVVQPNIRDHLDQMALKHKVNVDLSDNALGCHCHHDAYHTITWIHQSKVKFIDHAHYQCFGDQGLEVVIDKNLEEYEELCDFDQSIIEVICMTALVCFLIWLLLTIACNVYQYRYRIQRVYYKTRYRYRNRNAPRNNMTKMNPNYDIYISYGRSEDYFFVVDTVLKWLEDKYGFTCCVDDRDLILGQPHKQQIRNGMYESKIILILWSKSSMTDAISKYESLAAQDLEDDKKVISVLLDMSISDIPSDSIKDFVSRNSHYKFSLSHKSASTRTTLVANAENEFFAKLRIKLIKHIYKTDSKPRRDVVQEASSVFMNENDEMILLDSTENVPV